MAMALPWLLDTATLLLPASAIVWLWRRPGSGGLDRLLRGWIAGGIVLFAFLSGAWVLLSLRLRYLFPIAFMLALLRAGHQPSEAGQIRAVRSLVPLAMLVTVLDVISIEARFYPGTPVELSFPLQKGAYCVLQGGSNRLANPFHGTAERYALDLVKLNRLGSRAAGLAPETLQAYAVYGEPVHSPCAGTVLAAQDGLPDNIPGTVDTAHSEGNHVVLRCGDTDILLAHLMPGSLTVNAGDTVTAGTPLGRVGNSGNSAEPHLHIAAARGGAAVPVAFDGIMPALNDIMYR